MLIFKASPLSLPGREDFGVPAREGKNGMMEKASAPFMSPTAL
jgi:hypothetical protein